MCCWFAAPVQTRTARVQKKVEWLQVNQIGKKIIDQQIAEGVKIFAYYLTPVYRIVKMPDFIGCNTYPNECGVELSCKERQCLL